ncbi:MAG: 5-methyltetrahydropteroyltriglutamate--homocysteine S-methyltransferase [Gammaproteobacteria bacterium HGW-Gammaproteobacteria-3]|nr:MAG: 5-methyltetrahydropteroyltriglutamate--homocysteine S-methyltransferase [Gammaproteobacteria bacterium HGW-Gammaproteobacteria-3]
MIKIHNLGFPRLGPNRELKFALERYWRGDIDPQALEAVAAQIRSDNWRLQANNGIDYIPVGDFSLYDTVLDTSVLLGVIPERFEAGPARGTLSNYFRMARGQAQDGKQYRALEMTKWFDTNYHFLVPELQPRQKFKLTGDKLFREVEQLQALGFQAKPVLLGPVTWLWLAKGMGADDKLMLLESLLAVYAQILNHLADLGVHWMQLDEPLLVLDLPVEWKNAIEMSYHRLHNNRVKILLATYFGGLAENTSFACKLPVAGLHIDLIRAPEQLTPVLDNFPAHKVLSLGLIDGRNIWRSDLRQALATVAQVQQRFQGELWLAPSCSLLHVPVDLDKETGLDPTVITWLAFARQKLTELKVLRLALEEGEAAVAQELQASDEAVRSKRTSPLIHNAATQSRLNSITADMLQRQNPYERRKKRQQESLPLPLFPTTTIGSFPQTQDIRKLRQDYKKSLITPADYTEAMQSQIRYCIEEQEKLGLDVFVHGEAERNDMVEYFGEQLQGFVFTGYGWVQSYGSRCVKPPIIYGDISRPKAMTPAWISYAQSLTDKPVKGMLTGPVTILNWSFVRNDQDRAVTARQLALALRDEVQDLEQAGVKIIQIDEAALREGLPLRRSAWQAYLDWATGAFRLTAGGVNDATQIHTHMCYSEFNDIVDAIADMDADVITIETSRSNMELLEAFVDFHYPNDIGPGVYDIHSPNIPETGQIVALLKQAKDRINADQLWVNPDCGLKTRTWQEVRPALQNMVQAAAILRTESMAVK